MGGRSSRGTGGVGSGGRSSRGTGGVGSGGKELWGYWRCREWGEGALGVLEV